MTQQIKYTSIDKHTFLELSIGKTIDHIEAFAGDLEIYFNDGTGISIDTINEEVSYDSFEYWEK